MASEGSRGAPGDPPGCLRYSRQASRSMTMKARSCKIHWIPYDFMDFIAFHRILQNSLQSIGFNGFHWIPQDSVDSIGFNKIPWISLDSLRFYGFHQILQDSVDFIGLHTILWISLDSIGFNEFHWIPQHSMDFIGFQKYYKNYIKLLQNLKFKI